MMWSNRFQHYLDKNCTVLSPFILLHFFILFPFNCRLFASLSKSVASSLLSRTQKLERITRRLLPGNGWICWILIGYYTASRVHHWYLLHNDNRPVTGHLYPTCLSPGRNHYWSPGSNHYFLSFCRVHSLLENQLIDNFIAALEQLQNPQHAFKVRNWAVVIALNL